MNFKKICICVFSLIVFAEICAGQKLPLKYGKLEKREIALKYFGGADAVILCDYGQYMFDGRAGTVYFYFTRHLRIKILTEAGLRYATQQIQFYDLKEALYFSNNKSYALWAQTLNVNSKGKIVKSKIKSKNKLVTKADENFNASLTIEFPDVKPGSIIEYLITIPTVETVNPGPWIVQYDIPCLWNELRIITPREFSFAIKPYNIEYSDVSAIRNVSMSIQYPFAGRSIVYDAKLFHFIRKNVPPLPYSGNDIDYNNSRMFIKFMLDYASRRFLFPGMNEIIKATDPLYKFMNRSEKRNAFVNSGYIIYKRPDLSEIAKDLNKSEQFGIPLILNLGFKDSLKKLTGIYNTDEEKVMAIYHFVRDQLEWNKRYRIFVDAGIPLFLIKLADKVTREPLKMNTTLQKVIHKKEGTNSEINAILINMLRSAGFKTNPVLVSTLNTCYLDTSFFNLNQFNHLIAAVNLDGHVILLDAVKKDNGSIMTSDLINEFGLMIELRSARWIHVAERYAVLPRDLFIPVVEQSDEK